MPDYSVWQWKTEDGLPQNTVRCLFQTSEGYLWIGTKDGLARFDGSRFTLFDHTTHPEIPSQNYVALAEDAGHNLWIGTESGLLRWKEHRLEVFRAGMAGLSNDRVRYLRPAAAGGVWIATWNGLNLFTNGRFQTYTTNDGLLDNNIRAVFEDGSGGVWVGAERQEHEGNLQTLNRSTGRFISVSDSPPDWTSAVHAFVETAPGHLWWGNNAGLHEVAAGQVHDFGIEDGLSGEVVRYISPADDGALWVLTGSRAEARGIPGLHYFSTGKAKRIELAQAGIEEDLICCLQDREGNLWLGTRNDGLILLQPRRVKMLDFPELNRGPAQSVSASPDGSIWIASDRLYRYHEHRLNSYQDPVGRNSNPPYNFTAVQVTRGGQVVVGELHAATMFDDGRFVQRSPNGTCRFLYEDAAGFVWAGLDREVSRFDPGMTRKDATFQNDRYFAGQTCHAILEDHDGDFWIGTAAGAWHYALSNELGRAAQLIPLADGARGGRGGLTHLNRHDGLSGDNIFCFYEDLDHALWIGTDGGLDRFREGVIRRITARQGLPESRAHCIVEDDQGHFWIGCNHGVYRVSRRELNDVADGRIRSVHCLALGEADGMANSEVSSERQPVACKGPEGLLWFATGRGVTAVDPHNLRVNEVPPPVLIEQLRVDGQVFGEPDPTTAAGLKPGSLQAESTEGLLHLGPGHGRFVEIRFTAISFVSSARMRLEHQLQGYDEQWIPSPSDRIVRYNNLRPGAYRFAVRAANSDGVSSPEVALCGFVLAPHFYETWPFYPLCALMLVGAALFVQSHRLGVQRKVLALEAQHALDLERARIARDIHDDLGAGLTSISLEGALLAENISGKSAEQAVKLSREARQLIESLNETVWAVNPSKDQPETFISYISAYAQRFLESANIACRLELPEQTPALRLPSQLRHNLFLAFKEALHNVVKHSRASEVTIEVAVANDLLELVVSDNGQGCGAKPPAAGGNGLINMRSRLQAVGGTCEIQNRPPQGTQVRIRVSLN